MSIDLEKVSQCTRFVDALIQIKNMNVDTDLNESIIEELIQQALAMGAKLTEEEIVAAKRDITWKYKIFSTPGQSILADYEQDNWYDDKKSDIVPQFWTRYKDYLIDVKHFSPNVVSTLGDDTLDHKLMNYILNPEAEYSAPVLKRGLIIGDVQSGKTSTYIGFMCKAADAGYKVFILLTGTIEALRKQTQERVEEGFIGINMSADNKEISRVGVGLDNKPIHAMALTSRASDFTGKADKIAVSLGNDKDAVVFVIKKNTTSLRKLTNWLTTLNADPSTHKIDLPMLMIDDEADNASVNTSADKEDPTKINRLIRALANVFTKSNYVGFTATPFANVFIDPETTEKMENQDLFPEDFIVALPTPSNYIGPNKIFASDGEYHSQLVYIQDAGREEADGYSFYFKHTKEWDGDLPDSIIDALYTFYVANAIRDLRGDVSEHRSMLINISRFINVQKVIKERVEEIHDEAYRSLKYHLSKDINESMKDPVIKRIYDNWYRNYSKCEFSWEQISNEIFASIESIQIKIVNSSKASERLEYPKNESLRVIAIGGLALSRGLTLEGLVISYFFRNTCTYDVLMQMGRWFGYRKNYDDLFRIWTHKASAEWYAEIADATDKLKLDMERMRDLGQKPRDFGIRVRNNSAELTITAYNKMRNATDELEISSYFGDIVETPYLCFNTNAHIKNYTAILGFIKQCIGGGFDFKRQIYSSGREGHNIIQSVPKELVVDLIHQLKISKFSYEFDVSQICSFLSSCTDPSIDYFDVAFMDGATIDGVYKDVVIEGRTVHKVIRGNCIIDSDQDRLRIGQRGKLGGTSDGITGIVDINGKRADEIIEHAKMEFRNYKKSRDEFFPEDATYPSDTWFKFVSDRKPILLIYLIQIDINKDDETQKKQIEKFNLDMGDIPVSGFALGLPRNDNASQINGTKYKANRTYNYFERDEILSEGKEE